MLPICSWGQSYSDGITAHQNGDYETAFDIFQPLAENGDAAAQGILGTMYYSGQGVPKNIPEGVSYYQLAAENGDSYGMFNLAFMYRDGDGVPQDFTEAARLFGQVAIAGLPRAQYLIGLAYAKGEGVQRDNIKAHMWWTLSQAIAPNDHAARGLAAIEQEMTGVEIHTAKQFSIICGNSFVQGGMSRQDACQVP